MQTCSPIQGQQSLVSLHPCHIHAHHTVGSVGSKALGSVQSGLLGLATCEALFSPTLPSAPSPVLRNRGRTSFPKWQRFSDCQCFNSRQDTRAPSNHLQQQPTPYIQHILHLLDRGKPFYQPGTAPYSHAGFPGLFSGGKRGCWWSEVYSSNDLLSAEASRYTATAARQAFRSHCLVSIWV